MLRWQYILYAELSDTVAPVPQFPSSILSHCSNHKMSYFEIIIPEQRGGGGY